VINKIFVKHLSKTARTNFFQSFIDLFFPSICVLCDARLEADRKVVCVPCFNHILKYQSTNSFTDKHFDRLFILYEFDENMRILIHLLKYNHFLKLAEYFAKQALDYYSDLSKYQYSALVPVPLHKIRLRERGYNQSAVLAKHIGRHINLGIMEHYLFRKRNTPSQTHLNKDERERNVAAAFVAPVELSGERILLVDDVITTGSTANACASALKNAGADRVDVFALVNLVIKTDIKKNDLKLLDDL
jgi:ComF family protein